MVPTAQVGRDEPPVPEHRVGVRTVAVVSALTTGLSLAFALLFNGSLLEVLLGISLLQALVAAGALLFGYLARAMVLTTAEVRLRWIPWAFGIAGLLGVVQGLASGFEPSGLDPSISLNAATLLGLSTQLLIPTIVLASVRRRPRQLSLLLLIAWAVFAVASVVIDVTPALRSEPWVPALVEDDGSLTPLARLLALGIAVWAAFCLWRWRRRARGAHVMPERWLTVVLAFDILAALALALAGEVRDPLWWTSLVLTAGQYAAPAVGQLVGLVQLFQAMDRYERYLERRLSSVLASREDERRAAVSGAAQVDEARERTERLLDDGLVMAFQPIVELDSGDVVGIEALARSREAPDRGAEGMFVDAAACGLGVQLELAAARAALAALPEIGDKPYLAINLSPQALADSEAFEILKDAPLERIVVEVTERSVIEDPVRLREAIDALRDRGLRLAVDDTGAGHAGLRHIIGLRPDVLKLDRVLCHEIERDTVRGALASSLAYFTRAVGATLVAEGVETEADLQALARLGSVHGQGYLLGRPGPLEEALAPRPHRFERRPEPAEAERGGGAPAARILEP